MPSSNRPPRTYEPSFFNPAQAGAALPAGRPLLPKEARDAAFSPWVALELVPSWLRPFTLDENTRFTRTPDHFLRTRHGMGESPKVTSAPPVPPPAARDAAAMPQADTPSAAPPSDLASGSASAPTSGPTWRFLVEETEPETQTASMAWSDAAEPPVALETLRAAVGEVSAVAGSDLRLAAAASLAQGEMAPAEAAPTDEAAGLNTDVRAGEIGDDADRDGRADIAAQPVEPGASGTGPGAIEAPEDLASQEHTAAAIGAAPPVPAPEGEVPPDGSGDAADDRIAANAAGQAMMPADPCEPDGPLPEALPPQAPVQQVPLQDALLQDALLQVALSLEGSQEPSDPRPAPDLPETLVKLGRLICLGQGFSPRVAVEQDLLPAPIPRDTAPQILAPEDLAPEDLAPADRAPADLAPADLVPEGPGVALPAPEEPASEGPASDVLSEESLSEEPLSDAAFAPLALPPVALPPAVIEPQIARVAAATTAAPMALEPLSAIVGASFHWAFQGLNFRPEMEMPPSPAPSAAASAPSVPASPALLVPAVPAPMEEDGDADDAYELPALALLREPPVQEPDFELSEEFLDQSSAILQQTLRDFGVRGEVIDANPGPVVTLYEFEPAPGTKSSRVIGLAADIARSMSAVSVRVAVVEGRNVIGIELPNRRRGTVWLRELLEGPHLDEAHAKLAIALGKTIGGEPVIVDLARMPHLLVAGTTGSGKSVAINTMILSLLYRHTPQACRLIMIDPKMLELSVYEGIPHLLTPVVTDPKKAIIALKWAVREMEDRYRKMSRLGVRNIDGFNARMAEARAKGEIIKRQVQVGFDKETGEALFEEQDMDLTALPFIVIIVDEMADLMLTAGKEIEGAIQRLAQMARAAGIHLVMATQRPSVDVITGTIKANFPTRISFQVTSKIDSRTILGEMGAEQLLGQGDMLYMASGGRITRVHGPFVSDGEVEKVVAHLKAQGGPEYLDAVTSEDDAEGIGEGDEAVFDKGALGEASGDLYEQAVAIVLRDRKASTSYIQRRLQVGYNKAASLMERMETEGIVGPANHAGKREILTGARTL
ncbi:DNA translocase FtsK [Roseixanthobacter glucoisosaccharinicivorans]|uniref:DNA translocase FtsK n=1 Tax=Roseixanthobacter glucoisosaccharinicivorans TaxID=3119923 RepID=UPI00372C7BC5